MPLPEFLLWVPKNISLNKPITILFTKQPDADIVIAAAANGFQIDYQNFIQIDCVEVEMNDSFDHIVFTSANAVACVNKQVSSEWWSNKIIFCLEGKTAEALAGYNIVATAPNAAALARIIIENKINAVSFPASDIRREELPAILTANNVAVQSFTVYQTTMLAPIIKMHYDGYAFFSPSAVESFFVHNTFPESAICCSIGTTTADSLKKYIDQPIRIAKQPSQLAVLDELIKQFHSTSTTL